MEDVTSMPFPSARGDMVEQPFRLRNFDTLRLIAAMTVIFSHGFLIADATESNEPVYQLTGGILGTYGVFTFLILSGFLITHSICRSASPRDFAINRVLRIFPALALYAFIAAFFIAPFFSELGVANYLFSISGVRYVLNVLLLRGGYEIATVVFYNQDYLRLGHGVNGSLWTIQAEICCYLFLLFAVAVKFLNKPFLVLVMGGSLATIKTSNNFTYVLPAFCAGVLIYIHYKKDGTLSGRAALVFTIALILLAPTGALPVAFSVVAAYPIIYLGVSQHINLGNIEKLGDISYGTYLYGWPIEQVIKSEWPTVTAFQLGACALPIAMTMGWLSWHLLEKHVLRLKPQMARSLQATGERLAN